MPAATPDEREWPALHDKPIVVGTSVERKATAEQEIVEALKTKGGATALLGKYGEKYLTIECCAEPDLMEKLLARPAEEEAEAKAEALKKD